MTIQYSDIEVARAKVIVRKMNAAYFATTRLMSLDAHVPDLAGYTLDELLHAAKVVESRKHGAIPAQRLIRELHAAAQDCEG